MQPGIPFKPAVEVVAEPMDSVEFIEQLEDGSSA
jgi:hypothetical protein